MGFLGVWDQISVTIFARKDIPWRVRKPNAKQNRFHRSRFVKLFSSAYFLDVMSPMFPHVWQSTFSTDPWLSWADPERGQGVQTPLKNHKKNRISKQYWSRSPEKSQSYQASIQCWAIIGPPASDCDITFWIREWLYFKELYFRKDIHKRLFN